MFYNYIAKLASQFYKISRMENQDIIDWEFLSGELGTKNIDKLQKLLSFFETSAPEEKKNTYKATIKLLANVAIYARDSKKTNTFNDLRKIWNILQEEPESIPEKMEKKLFETYLWRQDQKRKQELSKRVNHNQIKVPCNISVANQDVVGI